MPNDIKTKTVNCDLCGSERLLPLYTKSDHKLRSSQLFQAVQCENCGLSFVNPQPIPEELHKLYPNEYYQMRGDKSWLKKYDRRLKYISQLPGRKLLDLGCAKGDFIRHIGPKGYEAMGIEEVGQDGDNDTILRSVGEKQIGPLSESFDIVTAWGVFEHMRNPSKYFSIAHKTLKNNGHLVFLVTNAQSISSRYLFGEDIPRHVTFFTPHTINLYAQKFGFRTVKIYHRNDLYSMPYNDTLLWLAKRLSGRNFTQEDTISFKASYLNQRPGIAGLTASRIVGRIARTIESTFNRNGILTAILRKES